MNKDADKKSRQAALLSVIRSEPLGTQDQVVAALSRRGVSATQVSISRDMAEMGVVKVSGRYQASLPRTQARDPEFPIRAWVKTAAKAGANLAVVRCEVGTAQRVGLAIDELTLPDVVGTIAGDDTVFCATGSARGVSRLVEFLRARIGVGS